jgi:hypothetical protein
VTALGFFDCVNPENKGADFVENQTQTHAGFRILRQRLPKNAFLTVPMPPVQAGRVHRLSSYSPIFPLKGPHLLPQDGSLRRGQKTLSGE